MSRSFSRCLLVLVVAGLAGLVALWFYLQPPTVTPTTLAPPSPPALSALSEAPDWSKLEVFQNTISRTDFERLLTTVFTTGNAWQNFIEITATEARIKTGNSGTAALFHLRFATPGHTAPTPRQWHMAADLPPAPTAKPLSGLRIAIDPGHLGGHWAQLEERWLAVGNGPPICEGDLTLTVAKLLQPRLTALGATVLLVRSTSEPVTPLRPDDLLPLARTTGRPGQSPAALRQLAERLFYRTAEIHARAQLVNTSLKPDLVLCLHFNADSWGNPLHPILVKHSHLHLLLNGAYTDAELALADQRFALLEKLLHRSHEEEASVGADVADVFAARTGLPPFVYPPDSSTARPVNNHPYLWARNLLANRLYACPVIFMEPYVMNSSNDFARLQAGDYHGLRKINGQLQPSIFREYADSLTDALAQHYAKSRQPTKPQ